MWIPDTSRIRLFKTTRRRFWDMGWTNFSFRCDGFGNPKTWWNNMIPNNQKKFLELVLDRV
jgi:hypothetical protein